MSFKEWVSFPEAITIMVPVFHWLHKWFPVSWELGMAKITNHWKGQERGKQQGWDSKIQNLQERRLYGQEL